MPQKATPPRAVIPAKAGIHFDVKHQSKMDSRFRGNDGAEGVIASREWRGPNDRLRE